MQNLNTEKLGWKLSKNRLSVWVLSFFSHAHGLLLLVDLRWVLFIQDEEKETMSQKTSTNLKLEKIARHAVATVEKHIYRVLSMSSELISHQKCWDVYIQEKINPGLIDANELESFSKSPQRKRRRRVHGYNVHKQVLRLGSTQKAVELRASANPDVGNDVA